MSNDETIDRLNHLLRINRDAAEGYRNASGEVQNSALESTLAGYGKQHARFEGELRKEIERLGGTPADSGSTMGGALHRGWMDFKAMLTGHSAASLLGACDDGELHAEVVYTDAVKENPTGQTLTLIDKHLEQIRGFRAHLKRLIGETKDGLEFQKNE